MTNYLHGLHVGSIRDTMTLPAESHPGWLCFTEIASPDGGDYRRYADAGHGIIVRLNHSYGYGTIPAPPYEGFAQWCADFVSASRGCHVWIIGNEPNHSQERPPSGIITPELYAECFLRCYAAIKAAAPGDLVLPAPIAPYNAETGDCLVYLGTVASRLAEKGTIDGWVLHAYTHGHDAALIRSNDTVGEWNWNFRTYRDQLAVLGRYAQDVPVYLTEANPTDAGWTDTNNGWIRESLCEIDEWNQGHPHQIVRTVCAFRLNDGDPRWDMQSKPSVVEDYLQGADLGYMWDSWEIPPEEEPVSGIVNPGLNRPYRAPLAGHENIIVANGWEPWWLPSDPEGNQADQPEYNPMLAADFPDRVLDGDASQHWFIMWRRMSAGIYQRINVGAGRRVTARVPFHVWCSQSDDPKRDDGELYMRIGLGRSGGTDPAGADVEWSNWVRGTNDWTLISLSLITEQDDVTLFVQAWNKWALKHNDIFVDAIEFEVEGDEPAPPPPIEGVLRVEITGPNGGPIQVQQVSAGLLARIRGLLR